MADVLPPHGISSKSMDELEATLREDDNNDDNVDHRNKQPRNGDGDDKDCSLEEGEEQEHEGPPPPMRTVETTNSNFSVQHIGDVEEPGPSLQDYPEVTYDKATPLFTAIEHTKWREAYQLAKEFPHQITTWVVCQNNELQPSLEFSLWRRLPLHEACRRQAPAWLVAQLISASPESVQCTTQFGEYPLHLAVECAATPEVVHVLVVAYWPAVVARDTSGRTPLDILEETELLQSPSGDSEEGARFSDISEAKIIYQSLERSQLTYLKMLEQHEQNKGDLELQHDQHIVELKQEHDQQLQQERCNHKNLEEKLDRLKGVNMSLQHEVAKKDSQLLALKNMENIYQDRVEEQKAAVDAMRQELDQKDAVIEQLQKALQEKETQILQERERATGLSHDVWHMTRLHDTQLQDVLQQAENALQNLVHCQLAVHGQWLGQHRALHHILQERGIPEPTPNAPTAHSETPAGIAAAAASAAASAAAAAQTAKAGKAKNEEREIMEEKKNEEEAMDANSAAHVAAAAARHALQSADERGVDEATALAAAAAEASREPPTDGAVVASTEATVTTAVAESKTERKLLVDSVVPGDVEKVKRPAKAGKSGVSSIADEEDDDDDEEDSDEEEDGDEDFDSDDDDDDEEYDSQEETDEDSGSEDLTSDEDDEESSGDEGEHVEKGSTLPTTVAWKKQ